MSDLHPAPPGKQRDRMGTKPGWQEPQSERANPAGRAQLQPCLSSWAPSRGKTPEFATSRLWKPLQSALSQPLRLSPSRQ